MIERYTLPEMGAVWALRNKFQKWLDVEIAVCEVHAEDGTIPRDALAEIKAKAAFTVERINEIEKTTDHDVIAFTTNLAENIGPASRFVHYGLTSSDVVDTANALLLRESCDILLAKVDALMDVIKRRANEFKDTPQIGRTHGIHAEPTSFGLTWALWYEDFKANRERLVNARQAVSKGKISGAVGAFAHLSPDVERRVCEKLGIEGSQKLTAVEKLTAYEMGDEQPSRTLIAKMVKVYHKPLLSFYLPKIAKQKKRGEDFRTLQNQPTKQNAILDILLRDIRARQDLLRETILEDDEEYAFTAFNAIPKNENVQNMAQAIVAAIEFDLKKFRSFRDVSDSFKYLRMLIESKGVFVLLENNLGSYHTDISPDVFRGFAIADSIAPMIIINSQDAKSAWCFTLLHELLHICIGATGISADLNNNKTEVFCNEVASLILLPNDDLKQLTGKLNQFDATIEAISNFALKNKLSASMVAYRLYKQNLIGLNEWQKIQRLFSEKWQENKAEKNKSESGPNYYVIKRQRLGDAILQFTKRMVLSGILTNTKAGFLLGVKPIKLNHMIKLKLNGN